jgi:2,4-dienoyl-CoA reductase (NADPH2)
MKGVRTMGGVNYEGIDAQGLHISHGPSRERPEVLACDTVVLCAGQVSDRTLADALLAAGRSVHVIGGADIAAELDAKRAIAQGARLAASL